jgi:hypothetical protein
MQILTESAKLEGKSGCVNYMLKVLQSYCFI